ncbi:AAA family ATPase [Saccharolobus caldissimus]|uniref:AAA family ATPase n=1 Tax=Saccharolobus caldissimus TaxID=1702097 RepID=UPI001E373E85|nr:AAA family ATPase [Saccharolobus caldissimus]
MFFDEVQNVKGYGSWFRKRLNARIFLSGSSSELTPLRITEELRGRSINFEVYPLSFREFLKFKDFTKIGVLLRRHHMLRL